MTEQVKRAYHACVRYFNHDEARIQHFTKVLQFSTLIGEEEGLDAESLETLQIAAITHDIGIPESERKYNNCIGKNQQLEGPPVAREVLAPLQLPEKQLDAVCTMISLHHSFSKIGDNLLLRMLVEADMLVNAFESNIPKESLALFKENIAKTQAGKRLLAEIYGV